MKVVFFALAGAAGVLCRYGIGVAIGGRSFPWTTLGINLTGSLLLGFVVAFSTERGWSSASTLPITIGFLGGYTTFSTFSYEAFKLIDDDRAAAAAAYIVGSVLGGVLLAAAGFAAARRIA